MNERSREIHSLTDEEHAELAHRVMHKQASLSLRVGALFIFVLLGLPLINYYMPEFANQPVFGFTLSWLFLGILFYPITWLLSSYFIKQSDRIEAECSDWRSVLGMEAGEPIEPQAAFTKDDLEEQK